MLYYLKKGKKHNWKAKICSVYLEGADPDQTCQKWFAKFHAGDFSLDDVQTSWSW